jgi:hypothetical protein
MVRRIPALGPADLLTISPVGGAPAAGINSVFS